MHNSTSYSIHGQLTNEVQNGGVLARTYDSLNRPTGYSLHEEETLRTSRTLREINYSYDTLGRFSGVGFNAEAQSGRVDFDYSYLPGTDLISGYTAGGFSRSVTYESDRNLIAAITNSFTPAGETYHLPLSTYHYSNDSLGRRSAIMRGGLAFGDLAGATDAYGYNLRSEVVSSRRTLADSPVRGFDYDYAYDPIGNRISATDYDEQGNPLVSSYSANALNQYTHRTVPGYAALRGEAATNATVTVNERPVWRINQSIGGSAAPTSARSGGNLGGEAAQTSPQSGSYFYGGDVADNTTSPVLKDLEVYAAINPPGTNTPDIVSATTGTVFIARTPETFTYDADGNMTSDGRFHYYWNGENRLVCASNADVVVTYAYDHRGRMVTKNLCSSAPLRLIKTTTYIWDNWDIIREIVREGDSVAVTDNVWGLDIDGTLQGAGGVGGLLAVIRSNSNSNSSLYLPTYDANGNISEYVTTNGEIVAHYDYSPFGEPLIETGALASSFTHRFSTKPWCPVTGLYEYQMRKYRPEIGRWLSRDPIGEAVQRNIFAFIHNESVGNIDYIGLIAIYIGGAAERMQKQLEGFKDTAKADIAYDFQQHDEIEKKIRERNKANPCETIILIGHSYGGDTALDVAAKFKDEPCVCIYVVTLDPVSHFDPETWIWGNPRTDNIKEWIHVYQRAGVVDATVAIPIVGTLFGGVYAGIGTALGKNNMVATGGGQWNHMRGADYNIRLPDEVDHHNVRGMLNQMIIDIDDKSKRVVDERGSPISVLDYIKQLKTMNCCEGRR